MKRIVPGIILSVFVIGLTAAAFIPERTPDGFRIGDFARLPVVIDGRIQPIDSVARAALLRIRGTSNEASGARQPGMSGRPFESSEWFLELLTKPDAADARKLFSIHESALLSTLKVSAAADGSYTYAELKPGFVELEKQAIRIKSVAPASRTPWETECLKLRNALTLYDRLKNSLQPNSVWQNQTPRNPAGQDFAAQVAQYQGDLHASVAEALGVKEGKTAAPDAARAKRMDALVRPFLTVSRAALFSVVPVPGQGRAKDRWQNTGDVIGGSLRTGQMSSAIAMLAGMSSGFARGNPGMFNEQVAKYRQWMTQRKLTAALGWARYEVFSTTFQPLRRALTIYVVALLLLAAARLSGLRELSRAAIGLIALAFLVHTSGVLPGMMMGGTQAIFGNIAGSVQVLGWAAVLVAAIAEIRWRNDIGVAAAAVVGLLTLAAGQRTASGGAADLVRLAQQTSFWLPLVATTVVAAVCLVRASARSTVADQTIRLAVAARAIRSAA